MRKTIWAENLLLLNKIVQKEGNVLTVLGSYTEFDGDLLLDVHYPPLSKEGEREYEKRRITKP